MFPDALTFSLAAVTPVLEDNLVMTEQEPENKNPAPIKLLSRVLLKSLAQDRVLEALHARLRVSYSKT